MPITRRSALVPRREKVRDATVFVIATEDTYAPKQYFEAFNIHSRRLHVEVLETGALDRNDPVGVLNRLTQFEDEYDKQTGDEFWLVLDVDRWPPDVLSTVCREVVRRRQYGRAVSNPCFELWLYLHIAECAIPGPDYDECLSRSRGNRSKAVEYLLRKQMKDYGGYNKVNIRADRFIDGLRGAIQRAETLDTKPKELYPTSMPGTHIYKLAKKLLDLLPPEWKTP